MGSNRYARRTGWLILASAALSVVAGYLFFSQMYAYATLSVLMAIILYYRLFRYINQSNEDLSLYLEGLINHDTSISLKKGRGIPGYEHLDRSLTRLSTVIHTERAENRVKEQFYKELITHSTTGLLAYDESGQIHIANLVLLKVLGVHHLPSVRTLENRFPQFFQTIDTMQPGKPVLFKLTSEGNTVPLQIRVTVFNFGDKSYRLLAFQNIKSELDEKEVESWQKLFRILSHEIMNSIAPITSLAQTISQTIPDESSNEKADWERIRKSALTIEEQSRLMMSFVERYRKLYKIPEPDSKPIPVEDWLTRFRILYHREMVEKKIRFEVLPSSVDHFIADDNLISQVVVDLLRNAQQAVGEVEEGTIRLSVVQSDNEVQVVVEDNGTGIPEAYADQIFIPFFTTRSGGNGIGLAISRQIVVRHGGTITFSSFPGKGTTFTVSLPG